MSDRLFPMMHVVFTSLISANSDFELFSLHRRPRVQGLISWADVSVRNSHGKSVVTNLGQGCLQDSTRWGIVGLSHRRFPPTPTGATWAWAQGSRHGQSPSTSRPVTRRHNGTIAEDKRLLSRERLSWQEKIRHWFLFHEQGITADRLLWVTSALWFSGSGCIRF